MAAYNVMNLKGNPQNLADIIKSVEKSGGLIADGLLGTNPEAYADYFNKIGEKATLTYDLSGGIDSKTKDGDVFMLLYSHNKGAHYIAVEKKGNEFQAYNTPNAMESGKYESVSSVDKWLADGNSVASAVIRFGEEAN